MILKVWSELVSELCRLSGEKSDSGIDVDMSVWPAPGKRWSSDSNRLQAHGTTLKTAALPLR